MNSPDANASFPLLRRQCHPDCYVCGPANGHGLGLEFRAADDGSVEACFACAPIFSGYPGMLHGGIVCTLLDGAMTNCLFAHGLVAVTVDMNVRFRRPVTVSLPAVVRAWFEAEGSPVYRLAAELQQAGRVVATGHGRFVGKELIEWRWKETP